MILDAFMAFTDTVNGDAPTTGTQNSTNVLDLHMSGIPVLANLQGARDIGIGDDPALKLVVWVVTTFASGTSLQIALQGATDNGSGAPGTFNNWWLSPAVAEAALVAGARLYDMDMPRPPAGIAIPRFLRLSYITVGTHTAGNVKGFIVLDRPDNYYSSTTNQTYGGYPAGVTVAN